MNINKQTTHCTELNKVRYKVFKEKRIVTGYKY